MQKTPFFLLLRKLKIYLKCPALPIRPPSQHRPSLGNAGLWREKKKLEKKSRETAEREKKSRILNLLLFFFLSSLSSFLPGEDGDILVTGKFGDGEEGILVMVKKGNLVMVKVT